MHINKQMTGEGGSFLRYYMLLVTKEPNQGRTSQVKLRTQVILVQEIHQLIDGNVNEI